MKKGETGAITVSCGCLELFKSGKLLGLNQSIGGCNLAPDSSLNQGLPAPNGFQKNRKLRSRRGGPGRWRSFQQRSLQFGSRKACGGDSHRKESEARP